MPPSSRLTRSFVCPDRCERASDHHGNAEAPRDKQSKMNNVYVVRGNLAEVAEQCVCMTLCTFVREK